MEMFRRATGRMLMAGLLAGAVGGAVGSAAKIAGEAVYPPRIEGQVPPPVVLAEKMAGHPLSEQQKMLRMQAIHWTFGIGTGAVYGAVAEVAPVVTVLYGAVFGVVLQGLTHETAVPYFGLDKPASEQPAREHTSELFTHVLYGVATELVRRVLRRRMRAA